MTHRIPTIIELFSDQQQAREDDQLNVLLNAEPRKEWVVNHPNLKDKKGKPWQYLPIDKVELMLTRIFGLWQREIIKVDLHANSMVATVRLHYWHPSRNQFFFQDGVGAAPIQVEKDQSPMNFNYIKSAGVQMSAPSAASYALSNAASMLGRVFGRDLNKDAVSIYDPTFKTEAPLITKPTESMGLPLLTVGSEINGALLGSDEVINWL